MYLTHRDINDGVLGLLSGDVVVAFVMVLNGSSQQPRIAIAAQKSVNIDTPDKRGGELKSEAILFPLYAVQKRVSIRSLRQFRKE